MNLDPGVGVNPAVLAMVRRVFKDKLLQFPDVAGGYLFGSVLDSDSPRDIDVGLIVSPMGERDAMRLEANVAQALGTVNGKTFDVSVLSPRDVFFAMSVLCKGRLVYETDADAVTDFIERVSRLHAELSPRHRRALDEVIEAVHQ